MGFKVWLFSGVSAGFAAVVGSVAIVAQEVITPVTPDNLVIPIGVVAVLFIAAMSVVIKVVRAIDEARYAFKNLQDRVKALESCDPCPLLRHEASDD